MKFDLRKMIAPVMVAAAMATAPAMAGNTLTPFECSINDDFGFAGFGSYLGLLVLNASVPLDSNNIGTASGAFISAPGQAFTGFQYSILGGCQYWNDEFQDNPYSYAVGDDSFGDAVFAVYDCGFPTSYRVARNWLSLYFAPGAAVDGTPPAILNNVLIALFGDDFTAKQMTLTGIRVNGRSVSPNLHGLQGCSAFDGTDLL